MNARIVTDPDWAAEVLRGACGMVDAIAEASITQNRVNDWTAHVRATRWDRKQSDLGIGMEMTLLCQGCGRYLPINSMTAEHLIPKSDPEQILTQIVLPRDRLSAAPAGPTRLAWEVYCAIHIPLARTLADIVAGHRSTYLSQDGIAHDVRNIVPMCASCNTRKGTRHISDRPMGQGGWTPARHDVGSRLY